jgi:HK97 family phage prohead protease
MDITTKTSGSYIAEIKSTTAETKAPNGSFEAILSVPTVDRDKEVVDPGAFDPLPGHMTIDIDHAMSVEKTVASGRPFYDGPVLKFEGSYASHALAQMVRSLVDEGHIRTMSVAYMNAFYEIDQNDGLAHLRKAELLNAGIVGIPSNREALITASKSLVNSVAEATDTKRARTDKDVATAQSAHDALVALGAVCETKNHEISTETNPEPAAAEEAAAKTPAVVDVASVTRHARVALTGSALHQ